MQQIPLIAAQIARPMVAYLNANGVDSTAYLDRVRIPGELIESGGWIAKKQLYDMLYDVVQRERRPDIILSAFSEFLIDDAAPIADAMKSARTLKDALRVVTRLAGLVYEGNEYFLRSEGKTALLCYRERDPVSIGTVAGQQATLAIFLKMIRLLAGCNWRPNQVRGPVHMDTSFQAADGWEECQRIHQDNYIEGHGDTVPLNVDRTDQGTDRLGVSRRAAPASNADDRRGPILKLSLSPLCPVPTVSCPHCV